MLAFDYARLFGSNSQVGLRGFRNGRQVASWSATYSSSGWIFDQQLDSTFTGLDTIYTDNFITLDNVKIIKHTNSLSSRDLIAGRADNATEPVCLLSSLDPTCPQWQ